MQALLSPCLGKSGGLMRILLVCDVDHVLGFNSKFCCLFEQDDYAVGNKEKFVLSDKGASHECSF